MTKIAIAFTFALTFGCTTKLPAGAECTESSACESGLSCLDVAQVTGTSCTVVGMACSMVCAGDGDCASLGSNFKCFAGCGSDMTCGEVGTP